MGGVAGLGGGKAGRSFRFGKFKIPIYSLLDFDIIIGGQCIKLPVEAKPDDPAYPAFSFTTSSDRLPKPELI